MELDMNMFAILSIVYVAYIDSAIAPYLALKTIYFTFHIFS